MKSKRTFLGSLTNSSTKMKARAWLLVPAVFTFQSFAQAETKIVRGIQVPVVTAKVEVPDSYDPLLMPEKQLDVWRGYSQLVQFRTAIQTEKIGRAQGLHDNPAFVKLNESAFKDLADTVEQDYGTVAKKGISITNIRAANFFPGTKYRDEAKLKRGYLFTQFSMNTAAAAQSSGELCQNFRDNRQMALLSDTANHLAISNAGGLFNAGVCWWHSSLTRAAAYLVIFKSNAQRPSSNEAKGILQRLAKMDQVVVIPGFSNLNEFSEAYIDLVRSELESMQTSDILGFDLRGLQGSSSNDSAAMKEQLDRAYLDSSLLKQPVYLMLQKPGIDAHSWIASEIQKTKDGYNLFVLDSSSPGLNVWKYRNGMKEFIDENNVPFIPYIDGKEKSQLAMIKNVVSSYCKQHRL